MSPQSLPNAATKRIRDAVAGVLRELRKNAGLSQEKLAAEAGYDRTYVGQIERSEKSITIITLFDLAHALKVSPVEIIEKAQSRAGVQFSGSVKSKHTNAKR